MAKKNENEESAVLTTKDDEINAIGKDVQSISKDDVGEGDELKKDVDPDEEDFTYEKPVCVGKEPEDIPSWKEVKSALRRLAALSLSTVAFEILEQSFPKVFGE
jgi:hypothetical protein